MKRIGRILFVLLINTSLFIAICEIAGLAYYYYENKELFYLREIAPAPPPPSASTGRQMPKLALHPVLGFIRSPSLPVARVLNGPRLHRMVGSDRVPAWYSLTANNFGFFCGVDYPYTPVQGREFVVGIFGGSVAQWFALQGGQPLSDRLQRIPGLLHKEVTVLNFAQGGFKQPQQLQALNFFLTLGQRFDYLVNIDGFNELALAYVNVQKGIHPAMPSAQHLLPIVELLDGTSVDPEKLQLILSIQHAEQRATKLDHLIRRNHSAALHLLYRLLQRRSERQYWELANALDALSTASLRHGLFHLNVYPGSADDTDAVLDYAAQIWMNSSLLMAAALRHAGVPYLHVLQPNQYFSNKQFTQDEKSYAVNPHSPYRLAIERGYPLLLERAGRMARSGLSVANAVELFDQVSETIYSDSCCHYNQRGNDLLADFIATQIASRLSREAENWPAQRDRGGRPFGTVQ